MTRTRTHRPCVGWVAVPVVVMLIGCGGGSPSAESKLATIRSRSTIANVTRASDQATAHRLETLLAAALEIAAHNAGKPVGNEAFAFAQQRLLAYDASVAPLFAGSAPPLSSPPAGSNGSFWFGYLSSFQTWLGFLAVTPEPYRPTQVEAKLRAELLGKMDSAIEELTALVATRQHWIDELTATGSTPTSWNPSYPPARTWSDFAVALASLRDITVKAREAPTIVAAWDPLIAAVTVAEFTPQSVGGEYRSGVFVSKYTRETVVASTGNLEQLKAALATAQAARAKVPAG